MFLFISIGTNLNVYRQLARSFMMCVTSSGEFALQLFDRRLPSHHRCHWKATECFFPQRITFPRQPLSWACWFSWAVRLLWPFSRFAGRRTSCPSNKVTPWLHDTNAPLLGKLITEQMRGLKGLSDSIWKTLLFSVSHIDSFHLGLCIDTCVLCFSGHSTAAVHQGTLLYLAKTDVSHSSSFGAAPDGHVLFQGGRDSSLKSKESTHQAPRDSSSAKQPPSSSLSAANLGTDDWDKDFHTSVWLTQGPEENEACKRCGRLTVACWLVPPWSMLMTFYTHTTHIFLNF